jgi:hypothetical protein
MPLTITVANTSAPSQVTSHSGGSENFARLKTA